MINAGDSALGTRDAAASALLCVDPSDFSRTFNPRPLDIDTHETHTNINTMEDFNQPIRNESTCLSACKKKSAV